MLSAPIAGVATADLMTVPRIAANVRLCSREERIMMNTTKLLCRVRGMGHTAALCALALGLLLFPVTAGAGKRKSFAGPPLIEAFKPGELLIYEISWSNIVTAGTAVMEVKGELLPNGKKVLTFTATTHSAGLVDKFYRVNDKLVSIFDPVNMQSLKFSLNESHGKKKRRRELVFDQANKTVISTLNDNPPETLAVMKQTQDALSSVYYLRTRDDFVAGKAIIIQVHDSGKNWSVEVETLGREQVKTPAGTFATIKVRTFPKYEGVFMNKGEIFIWLTDDLRKVPVLMKSTIAIGAIVSTLTKMDTGMDAK